LAGALEFHGSIPTSRARERPADRWAAARARACVRGNGRDHRAAAQVHFALEHLGQRREERLHLRNLEVSGQIERFLPVLVKDPDVRVLIRAVGTAAIDRLRRLLQSAGYLAAEAPGVLMSSEIARGLDNSIVEAAIACALPPDEARTLVAPRQHARIIREFAALVEQNEEGSLYLPEVCIALRVSGRTFRQCALLRAKPGEDTVTGIATRFGFWELGRFSVAYHDLFGEPPMATLRRYGTPPDRDLGYLQP
jgi:hypothetical protein